MDKREKKKVMISQPMAGKLRDEIFEVRAKAVLKLKDMGYEVVNTLFDGEWERKQNMEEKGVEKIPLYFLAKSLEKMSLCDAVYFCDGWEKTRGCYMEHEAAVAYGLKRIYEEKRK